MVADTNDTACYAIVSIATEGDVMLGRRVRQVAWRIGMAFLLAMSSGPAYGQLPPLKGDRLLTTGIKATLADIPITGAWPSVAVAPVTLEGLIVAGLEQHPRLAQAGFAIDAARGRAVQAGLYPNPTISATFDELGDRTGPKGVNTLPLVSQELVTAGKLRLDRAAACREVDQATWTLLNQRYLLIAGIRQAYFDVLTLNRRIAILDGLVGIAEQSVATTQKLVDARQLAPLDVVQLEVELGRLRVARDSARKELPAALRRLATAVGVPTLTITSIAGELHPNLPDYELDRLQTYVLDVHPEVKAAMIGIEKARLLLRRAEVQPIPNLTVGAGYVRQNQNRSDDWTIGVSVPVPVWNRNQGNIQAARAAVADATKEVSRVENDLADRLAAAMREFSASRQRVESLKPLRDKAEQALRIVREARTMTTLQRLESQRSLSQVDLEYVQALGEAWKAASVISGLTLEDQWPPAPVVTAPLPPKQP